MIYFLPTVHEVFENVADKYDVMNDLMSGGIHRIWKDLFIARINPRPNTKLLDVAGGTGGWIIDKSHDFISSFKTILVYVSS